MEQNMGKAQDSESQKMKGKNLRFERKYIFENRDLEEVIQLVYSNSFCFKEVYEQRKINNIYFDNNNYTFYHQNVSGVGERKKIRLRWYNSNFDSVKDATIETKIKYGEVGDKLSFKILNVNSKISNFRQNEIVPKLLLGVNKVSNNIELKEVLSGLQPTLFNSYERKYYLSFCGKFRITLDFNQEFFDPEYIKYKQSKKIIDPREIVLELKYDLQNDFAVRRLSQEFNVRLSKNSKYVNGVNKINFLNS